jgi:hypothetical protein
MAGEWHLTVAGVTASDDDEDTVRARLAQILAEHAFGVTASHYYSARHNGPLALDARRPGDDEDPLAGN